MQFSMQRLFFSQTKGNLTHCTNQLRRSRLTSSSSICFRLFKSTWEALSDYAMFLPLRTSFRQFSVPRINNSWMLSTTFPPFRMKSSFRLYSLLSYTLSLSQHNIYKYMLFCSNTFVHFFSFPQQYGPNMKHFPFGVKSIPQALLSTTVRVPPRFNVPQQWWATSPPWSHQITEYRKRAWARCTEGTENVRLNLPFVVTHSYVKITEPRETLYHLPIWAAPMRWQRFMNTPNMAKSGIIGVITGTFWPPYTLGS